MSVPDRKAFSQKFQEAAHAGDEDESLDVESTELIAQGIPDSEDHLLLVVGELVSRDRDFYVTREVTYRVGFYDGSKEPTVEERVERAYAIYDSDPRVHGPDDIEAFRDALTKAFELAD